MGGEAIFKASCLLVPLLLAGCASSREPRPGSPEAAARGSAAAADSVAADSLAGVCRRHATVTVHVRNESSMDVQISFGPYTPARAADGFSRTTFQVPRPYVENYDIGLTILRGGLQIGGPATIPTEYVICNDATLIIGPRPRYSFFHGDVLHEPQPDEGGEQPADSADADTAVSK